MIQPTISLEMPLPSQGHFGFHSFRLLTDFVCLYSYEFWLSLCKIVRGSVILLLPLLNDCSYGQNEWWYGMLIKGSQGHVIGRSGIHVLREWIRLTQSWQKYTHVDWYHSNRTLKTINTYTEIKTNEQRHIQDDKHIHRDQSKRTKASTIR